MKILGISCYYHDAAACLLDDGKVIAAAQEERFTRWKHDWEFPKNAIEYCLKEGRISIEEVDAIGFYDKPFIKFERILQTYIATYPKGWISFLKAIPLWLKKKIWMSSLIEKELHYKKEIYFSEHHLSHAASAFYASGFDEAAVLTADGVGEWATTSVAVGKGLDIQMLEEIYFPHSLGLLYSAFTYYLGFKVNSGEYKVMGLAPYGQPRFQDLILEKLIDLKGDGSFKLNLEYFTFPHGLRMVGRRFERLFGTPRRNPETELKPIHFDLAASIQKVTEEAMLRLARHTYEITECRKLCLAGGVALNCVANGRILREGPFQEIFIQPAAGDAGGAYGVASLMAHAVFRKPRVPGWGQAFWGPAYSDEETREVLDQEGAVYQELKDGELVREVAKRLAEGKVVGWVEGRMEFGPRALGHRSILADPRDPRMKDTVNLKIKFRETFRPFAPIVVEEKCPEYFGLNQESPFMLLVAPVHENKRVIPSVTHVDGSARIQTLSEEDDPTLYSLIQEFGRLSGVPVLINTSFNVRGEPIVCTPQEAWRCFMRTKMDCLVVNRFLLDKEKQTREEEPPEAWLKKIPAD